jgi:peptidoglycan/LPS O-acetylase OafA/YrhL
MTPEEAHGTIRQRILSRFARVTTSGNFISEIDGLRFVAIATVVLFHLVVNLSIKNPATFAVPESGNLLVSIARHGFRGVELFFIISGFILAVPFAAHHLLGRSPVRLRQYFLRRVTRLEPPYLLCMTILVAARLLLQNQTASYLLPHYGASLVYLHNILFGTESPVNNVAWSLEIEIQFYLLVPLLARLFTVRSTRVRRGIIAVIGFASVTCSWLFIGPESVLYLTIARFLHFFLIGFLLADIFLVSWKETPRQTWRWDIVSLVGWPLLFAIWNSPEWSTGLLPLGTRPVIAEFMFPLLALPLYVAVFRGRLTHTVFTNVWITTLGGMCYTMYLFHNQIIGMMVGFTNRFAPFADYTLNVLVQAVMVLPPMVILVALYFAAIEKPCMRRDWPRRFADRVKSIVSRVNAARSSPAVRDAA